MYDFSKTYYGYSFDEDVENEDIVIQFDSVEEAMDAAIKENPNADTVYIFDYYPFKYEVDGDKVLAENSKAADHYVFANILDNIELRDKDELSRRLTKVFRQWINEMGLYKEFGTFEGPEEYSLKQYKENLKFEE